MPGTFGGDRLRVRMYEERVKVPGTFGGDRLNRRVRMQDGKDSEESVTL